MIIMIMIIIIIIITIRSITIIITDFKSFCFGMTLDDTRLDESPAPGWSWIKPAGLYLFARSV